MEFTFACMDKNAVIAFNAEDMEEAVLKLITYVKDSTLWNRVEEDDNQ